jgi:hypothetical protein
MTQQEDVTNKSNLQALNIPIVRTVLLLSDGPDCLRIYTSLPATMPAINSQGAALDMTFAADYAVKWAQDQGLHIDEVVNTRR